MSKYVVTTYALCHMLPTPHSTLGILSTQMSTSTHYKTLILDSQSSLRAIVTLRNSDTETPGWVRSLQRRITSLIKSKVTVIVKPGTYGYDSNKQSEDNVIEVPANTNVYAAYSRTAFFSTVILGGAGESHLRGLVIDTLTLGGAGPSVTLEDCQIGTLRASADCDVHITNCHITKMEGDAKIITQNAVIKEASVSHLLVTNTEVVQLTIRSSTGSDGILVVDRSDVGLLCQGRTDITIRNSLVLSLEAEEGAVSSIRMANSSLDRVHISRVSNNSLERTERGFLMCVGGITLTIVGIDI